MGSIAGLVEALVLRVERLDGLSLASERLDDGVARMHLLDVAVEGAGGGPLGNELPLRTPDDQHDHSHRHGDGKQ